MGRFIGRFFQSDKNERHGRQVTGNKRKRELTPIQKDLKKIANPLKAKVLAGFFKTGKGQYGEGDIFLGVTVPQSRMIAKRYWKEVSLEDVGTLLQSPIHEERLVALIILVEKYSKADQKIKKTIYDFYIVNARRVNNWDLVDLTAHRIVGDYLFERDKTLLYRLAKSDNLWERRISIVATLHFIKKGKYDETFKIAELLLCDQHDLIHKAVGWMLREVGKRDQKKAEVFLKKHCKVFPRTTLRYAIERFEPKKRQFYLAQKYLRKNGVESVNLHPSLKA